METKQMTTQTPMTLIELGIKNGKLDIETLDKLMEMQFKYEERQSKKEFYRALNIFQASVKRIEKKSSASFETRSGGAMTYSYANLDDIMEAIKPALKESGLTISYHEEFEGDKIKVFSKVTLDGIFSIETHLIGKPDNTGLKNELQQLGSTIEYLRRYGMTSLLGLSTGNKDDDGKSGGRPVEDQLRDNYMKLLDPQLKKDPTKWEKYDPKNWKKKNPTAKDYRVALAELNKAISLDQKMEEVNNGNNQKLRQNTSNKQQQA